MTRKELSAAVAEATARTEAARAGIEAARERQEEAVARQEEATAQLEKRWAEADVRWEERTKREEGRTEELRAWMREASGRQEKMLQDHVRRTDEIIAEGREWTKQIIAELNDQRDERRALMEALLQLMDRLPPPPPHLRSA